MLKRMFVLLMISFLLISEFIFFSFAPKTLADGSNVLFSDGFESGLSMWDGTSSYSGGMISTDTSHPHTGNFDMFVRDIYYTTNTISGAWCYKALTPIKAAYMSTYMMFNSMPTVDSGFQNWGPSLANSSSSGYLAYCGLMKNASGTYWGVQMQLSGGGSSYFYESVPSNATANTWYSVEVYDKVDPVNGVISMWVNDVVKLNYTGLNTAQIDTDIRYCKVIGVGANQASPVSVYFDDVVVSTAYVPDPRSTIPGDINGDYKVTLTDLVLLANAYGSTPGSAKWSPNADINGDGKVDLADLAILAQHYGQHNP